MSFDWLKPKSRVSIIACMENMHGNIRFTPLYATAYAIMNSMENLRLDKEGLFPKFSFPRVKSQNTRYRNTCGSLVELEIAWKH